MSIKRGEIFYAELNPVIGSEQGGTRPVLVIQNDIGNQYSPTTIIAAITSQITKAKLPTHVEVNAKRSGLERNSVILTEQIRTIDKIRLKEKVAVLDEEVMLRVDEAVEISLGLTEL
ncbi:MAG: type II toxin-antitoxin system PemK/MazF family toxin [Eubacteriales bacterium]